MIEAGADVNAKNGNGCTPLHRAAQIEFQGDTRSELALMQRTADCCKVFINAGADVNAKDTSDSTPLHYAAQSGNLILVRLLADSGADLSVNNNQGRTPLQDARYKSRRSVVQYLQEIINTR